MLKKSTLLSVSIFFLLFIGLSDYGYGCHRDDASGDPIQHGSKPCNGGGGGGGVVKPTVVQTTAQWGGGIDELVPRPCVAQQMQPSGSNGSYDCELRPNRELTFNLGVGEQTLVGGEPAFCSVFTNGFQLAPNFQHFYGWNGKCFESECTIRIQNWFHDMENVEGTNGAHIIVLRAFARLGPFPADKNPFVALQPLDVVEIDISFGDGAQDLAVCQYSLERGNLAAGEVTFTSVPEE